MSVTFFHFNPSTLLVLCSFSHSHLNNLPITCMFLECRSRTKYHTSKFQRGWQTVGHKLATVLLQCNSYSACKVISTRPFQCWFQAGASAGSETTSLHHYICQSRHTSLSQIMNFSSATHCHLLFSVPVPKLL